MKKIIGLIPCRLKSTRLEEKALLDIDGLPLIIHTLKRVQLCKELKEVIVCTDSTKIKKLVLQHGGKCRMTKSSHKTGTDRIAEISKKINYDVAIDIQGDFPFVNPSNISRLIKFHLSNNFDIVVPSSPIKEKDAKFKDVVKLVSNDKNKVLYFSRSIIPNPFKSKPKFYLKHMSIISFNKKSLEYFSKLKEGKIEKSEGIELMRAVENNMNVGTFKIDKDIFSVDVKKDYLKSKKLMPFDRIRKKY